MNDEIRENIKELREQSGSAYVACINEDGNPVTRAMLVLEHDSYGEQYFSTNTSSSKVACYQANPKASVYYCEPDNFKGVLFVGDMKVCTDQETKDFLWREGIEKYYPKGVTDPDYCVLRFTAKWGSYYHGLQNTKFTIDEL